MGADGEQVFTEGRWLAQVEDRNGAVHGVAWLCSPRTLLVNAAVLAEAGGAPHEVICLRFLASGERTYATVDAEVAGGVAVLRLSEPVAGTAWLPVAAAPPAPGEAVVVSTVSTGAAAGRRLLPAEVDETGTGVWVRARDGELVTGTDATVGPGMPVWSPQRRAAVAVVDGEVARSVPQQWATVPLAGLDLEVVRAAACTGLDREPSVQRWLARAAGTPLPGGASLFAGRRAMLADLAAWLEDPATPRRLRVVVGSGGTGVSSVLARLAVATDPQRVKRLSDLAVTGQSNRPPTGVVDVVFDAAGRGYVDLSSRIVASLDLRLENPGGLSDVVEAVQDLGRDVVVVVDAVDDARSPRWLCRLLRGLTEVTTCRVLAGGRPVVLDWLPDPDPLHLDQPPHLLDTAAVDVAARLLCDGTEISDDARAEAETIAAAARGNLLGAVLAARAVHRRHMAPADHHELRQSWEADPEPATLPPADVDAALADYLDAVDPSGDASGVLLPLAYCADLPLGPLWYTAVEVLHGAVPPATIDAFVTGPAATLLEVHESADGAYFRLAHEELACALRRKRDVIADRRHLLAAWRQRYVPEVDGERRWERAPTCLLAKAVDLAADAGALDLLSGDLTYLAVGPLQVWRDRLLPTDLRDPVPNLVRIVAEWADPLPADRRATMLVLAARSFRAGQELADRLITVLQPAWETVGVRHSGVALEPHGPVAVPEVWPVLGTPWHQVYEAASGWPISVLLPHEHVGGVQCAAMFVVDGAVRVVTGGSDGRLQVWDAATGVATSACFTAHVGPVTGVTMLGVGNDPWIVSTGYNGTITAHDAFTGDATMPTIHAQGSTSAVAVGLVAGAPRIVTGGSERNIQLWDPLTGEPAGQHDTGHTGAICAVTVAELGGSTRIVTASEDRTIRVWDPDDHTCVGVIDCFDVPGLLAPFPNGSLGFKPSKTFSAYVWIRPGRPDNTEEASGTGTGGGRRHRQ